MLITASPAHSLLASAVSWESFAITDSRWLIHAIAWSSVLLTAMGVLPWLFTGYSVILGIAVLAAGATAYTGRREPTILPPPTIVRYMLVDGIFTSFAIQPLFVLIQLALAAAGFLPRASGPGGGHILIFSFVCGFYLCLASIEHARSSVAPLSAMPMVAAAVVAGLLILNGYPRFVDYAMLQRARNAGVAAYEQATGKHTDELARLSIGNSLHGFDNRVYTVTSDTQGRLLVSGGFSYYAGKDARGFVRLLPDGQFDHTFVPLPLGDPGLWAPSTVRLAADGTIVINASIIDNKIAQTGLARVQPDGTVDSRFKPDMKKKTMDQGRLELMDLQPDGKLIVASLVRFPESPHDACLFRFDADGAHDTGFEAAAMEALYGPVSSRTQSFSCSIAKITVLATGQILVEGAFLVTGMRQGLVRLNSSGRIDESYRPELSHTQFSLSFVTPTGEVFAVSHIPIPGSSPSTYEARCIKPQANGQLDRTFNIPDGHFRRIEQLAVQPDGKVVIAGSLGEKDYGAIVRLLPNGQTDHTFGGPEGVMRVDGFLTTLVIQPDGRIVLGGEFQQMIGPGKGDRIDRQNIARLLPDGRPDPTFNPR